ncbi:MAG TPA: CHASE2 domain-containing protein [Coleofasciculaceae cyanobacterium]
MSQLVVLNLGKGNWQQGCASVIAQLWQADRYTPIQFLGSLPPAAELGELYERWQRLYQALYAYKGWRRIPPETSLLEIEIDEAETEVTNISEAEFSTVCRDLQHQLNTWLNDPQFRPVDRQLRTHLRPEDEIRCIIVAADRPLLRLPWRLWQFFDDYPKVELALSLPDYMRAVKSPLPDTTTVNILAILGNRHGIDVAQDQQLLEQLPHTHLRLLVEPDLPELSQQLWEQNWDMLFFAGHSATQAAASQSGRIQINRTQSLTIDQLRYGLKRAIAHGLKLAIFNSCDGLGLAWDLADLQIPQVIVMREPVPDRVAQEFLKHFLLSFTAGHSLYRSVQEAREQLQALETEFPCATWLPVICQNPAELPQTWQEWRGEKRGTAYTEPIAASALSPSPLSPSPLEPAPRVSPPRQNWRRILLSSLLIAGGLMGVRSLGVLQPLELWAFDRLLTLRPSDPPDDRLLIVTIDEADIQAQDPTQRRASLSDPALNQVLTQLERAQARVIGLDLYRDFPVSANLPQLAKRLQHTQNLFAVCKSSDRTFDPTGTKPPPEVSTDRLGFSDFLEDEDGVLRRQILFITPDADCPAPYAFSTQLALQYLANDGIEAQFTPDKDLQLGRTIFHHLQRQSSGYQTIDPRGSQVLLNYRSLPDPSQIAPRVSLTQLLKGQVNARLIRNRIVLIGTIAASDDDYWSTPYGARTTEQIPGVLIQAHMVSQMLSAVLNHRPLIWVWSTWIEGLWVWGWVGVGIGVIQVGRSTRQRGIIGVLAIATLTGISWVLLLQGGWVPLLPAAIGGLVGAGSMVYLQSRPSPLSKTDN